MKTGRVTKLFCSVLCASQLLTMTVPVASAQQPPGKTSTAAQNETLLQFTAGGHILGFTSSEMYAATGSHALHVDFVGANRVQPQVESSASADGKAAPLGRVQYPNLWPGITLTVEAASGGILHSTYQLEAGANVSAIQLRYNAPLTVNRDGSLAITFDTGALNESAPRAWQVIDEQQVVVEVSFTQHKDVMGFILGAYDTRYPLTIDPTLTWNTFLGSGGPDEGNAITVDGGGNVYVAGWSSASWGTPVRAYTGGNDAYAAKLDSSGVLQWNTFLGGSVNDFATGVEVDASGNVYLAGTSESAWGSPIRAYSGNSDAFAAMLDASGALHWTTFLGWGGGDEGKAITVDSSSNVYVAGWSYGSWGAPVRALSDGPDAFAAKLDSSGALQWNTFLGGSSLDYGRSIVVDGSGNVYIAGDSHATWGTPVRTYTGNLDAFAAKLDSSGALQWNTFLGGSNYDWGHSIAVNGGGSVYIAGYSLGSWGTPVRAFSGSHDAFAAKLNPSGALQWNTFLGGNESDGGYTIAVDGSGNVYLAGSSRTTWGSPVRAFSGTSDAFAARLDSSGALQWSTFLGSNGSEWGYAIELDGSGNVYLAGVGNGTWGAPVRPHTSGYDAIAAKLDSSGALQWNTFLGGRGGAGNAYDEGYSIALDGEGNIYVAGSSKESWGSPVRGHISGDFDAFAAKLDPNGALQWNTFLGGTWDDFGEAIAVDGYGNVFVAGDSWEPWSCSPVSCTVRAFRDGSDSFAAKLDADGVLQWNTFLGSGSIYDHGRSIAADGSGNVYIAGDSGATWGIPVRAYSGGLDAFAAKLNSSGAVQWNTFLGSSGDDNGNEIALDGVGNVYVAGNSKATWGSPVRPHAPYGESDAFAAKLDASGALQWNTFLGGVLIESGNSIAVDEGGSVFVAGNSSSGWGCSPVTCTVRPYSFMTDAFVAQLDSNGALQWNTFLGGGGGPNETDEGTSIVLDGDGSVYVTGNSGLSWGMPVRAHSFGLDAFAAKLDSSGALQWNTFLGAAWDDSGNSIAVDEGGNSYLVGTSSVEWGSPVRPYSGDTDAFVVELPQPDGSAPGAFARTEPSNGATGVSTSPTLSWGASSGATFYMYCYDTTNDNLCSNWINNGAATSVGLSGLNPNTTYYWNVLAYNSFGNTYADRFYAYWSFTTGNLPGAFGKSSPANTATGVSTSPTLSWGASSGATSYEYCYDTTNDNACSMWINSSLNTSIALSGLNNNTTYYWHVRSINSYGTTYSDGSATAFWSFTTAGGSLPGAFGKSSPENAATGVSTSPTLSWAASSGATGYEYCYDNSNDSNCSGWNSAGAATSLALSGLSPNTTYYWHMRANNSNGTTYSDGSAAAFWSFTTAGDSPPGAFGKSSPANEATGVSNSPTLSWTASSGAAGYEYCYDASNDSDCSNWNSAGMVTSVALSGLSPYTTYFWHVRANNPHGTTYSNASAVAFWSFTTGNTGSLSLTWNTFLGSTSWDDSYAVAVDDAGNIYVAGYSDGTWGTPLRASSGADAFVARLDASGVMQWNTFLGGSDLDRGYAIALDGIGNVYVAGFSGASWGSPVRPFSGYYDAFVARLGANGALQWNTFLGGSERDIGYGIAVNPAGNLYLAGDSNASWGSPLRAFSGVHDAFTARLDPSGALQWNTFLGGSGIDFGSAITVDGSGDLYLAGSCYEAWGSPVRSYTGGIDGFAARLDSNGGLLWHTFLGGSGSDSATSIAVDGAGNLYLAGTSDAQWGAPVRLFSGSNDAFAARLDSGGALLWNTFLGGESFDQGYAIAANAGGTVYLAGYSFVPWGTPITAGGSILAARLNSSGDLQWNTNLGGGYDVGRSIALDRSGNLYLTGKGGATWGTPVRPYAGLDDAFAVKLLDMTGDAPGAFNRLSPAQGASNVSSTPILSWDYSSGAAFYEYCIDSSDDSACDGWIDNGAAASLSLSGLDPHTTYYWHVRAVNNIGTTYSGEQAANFWSFTTGDPPGAFEKSTPADDATGVSTSLSLSWTESSGATGYEYCYDATNDNACAAWANNGSNTSVGLGGLSAGTTYYWHVRAINNIGSVYSDGSASTFWSFTTGTMPGEFSKISPINEATDVSTSPTLSWGPSIGAASYEYCYDTIDDEACNTSWISVGTNVSVVIGVLNPSTFYYWQVRAINPIGTTYSDANAWWNFKIESDKIIFLPILIK